MKFADWLLVNEYTLKQLSKATGYSVSRLSECITGRRQMPERLAIMLSACTQQQFSKESFLNGDAIGRRTLYDDDLREAREYKKNQSKE